MAGAIAIIGGNIAGLSAAYHLAEKGCRVTVYEKKIWDKPCGGAISTQFAAYLKNHMGIRLNAVSQPVRPVRCGFHSTPSVLMPGLFVIISRYHLQKELIARLRMHPNVEVVFRQVNATDRDVFTPQTVLATGYSALTRKIIQRQWNNREYALICKGRGAMEPRLAPKSHLMIFNTEIRGYGWIFFQNDGQFNLGTGGLINKTRLFKEFERFRRQSVERFHYPELPLEEPAVLWKVPIALKPASKPLAFKRQAAQFIGVGDALGLAHPIVAAGIEPAWQSGWLLGEAYMPEKGAVDVSRYRTLLKKNLHLTSRKPIDRVTAWLLRYFKLPEKEKMAYVFLQLNQQSIMRSLTRYPWFARVHDGSREIPYAGLSRKSVM